MINTLSERLTGVTILSKNQSIGEIAKLANVSVSTVSRAFKPDGKINEDTRKTILDIANSLGKR